jgi:hypothetical protein
MNVAPAAEYPDPALKTPLVAPPAQRPIAQKVAHEMGHSVDSGGRTAELSGVPTASGRSKRFPATAQVALSIPKRLVILLASCVVSGAIFSAVAIGLTSGALPIPATSSANK